MLNVPCGQGIKPENFIDRGYFKEETESSPEVFAKMVKEVEEDGAKWREQSLKRVNDARKERGIGPITWEQFNSAEYRLTGMIATPRRKK